MLERLDRAIERIHLTVLSLFDRGFQGGGVMGIYDC